MAKRLFSPIWALTALCVAFGPTPSNAAQVAASIEYGFVARPFGLPDDLQPLPGTSLKFLSIKASMAFWLMLPYGNRKRHQHSAA
jgi:hypothetical protein